MKLPASLLLLFMLGKAFANSEVSPDFDFLLIGGGINTCSSTSYEHCEAIDDFLKTRSLNKDLFKTENSYLVNKLGIEGLYNSPFISLLDTNTQRELKKSLESLLGKKQFYNKKDLLQSLELTLSSKEEDLVLDAFETNVDSHGKQRHEQVFLAANENPFSTSIVKKFVQMARNKLPPADRGKRPKVLYMTSSSRDPFSSVAFYQQLLDQAGAEASWFPLDVALRMAIRKKDCDHLDKYQGELQGNYFRKNVYPDLVEYQRQICYEPNQLINLLNNAQGIFINGGDQSLTLKAFKSEPPSPVLALISRLITEKNLVMGGTSAGAAVQSGGIWNHKSIPMIVDGSSLQALKDGSFDVSCKNCNRDPAKDPFLYESEGGLGLFPIGVIDTHFSQRARQFRLIRLAIERGIPFAFGIDETTGLLGREDDEFFTIQIIGENGLWFFDLKQASLVKKDSQYQIKGVIARYLTLNDRIEIQKNGNYKVSLSKNKQFFDGQQKLVSEQVLKGKGFLQLTQNLGLSLANEAEGTDSNLKSFNASIKKGAKKVAWVSSSQINGYKKTHVSISPVRIEATWNEAFIK